MMLEKSSVNYHVRWKRGQGKKIIFDWQIKTNIRDSCYGRSPRGLKDIKKAAFFLFYLIFIFDEF